MKKKIIDQDLRDAAGKSATETHPICMVTVDDTTFDTNHHGMIAHFHGFMAGAEWQKEQNKPSIPTDEEIERKAHNNYTYGYLMPIGSHDRSRYEEKKESYTSGYKQALKDIGHADN